VPSVNFNSKGFNLKSWS